MTKNRIASFVIVGAASVIAISSFLIQRDTSRPRITIVREELLTAQDLGPAIIVEYTVDGIFFRQVFYKDDAEAYARFRHAARK